MDGFKRKASELINELVALSDTEQNEAIEFLRQALKAFEESKNVTKTPGNFDEYDQKSPSPIRDSPLSRKPKKIRLTKSKSKTQCVLCGKSNANFSSLLRHLFHHKGAAKSCFLCKKTFKNAIGFEYHKVMKLCDEKLPVEDATNANRNSVIDRLALKSFIVCPYCSERFTKFFNLRRHLSRKCMLPVRRSGMKNCKESEISVCPFCKCTSDASGMIQHVKEAHNYICEKCGKSFNFSTGLKRHMTVHKEEVHSQECKKCGEIFKSIKSLKKHNLDSHKQLVPCHVCIVCERAFFTRNEIRLHMKEHSVEERKNAGKTCEVNPAKTVKCHLCDGYFKTTSIRKHQMRKHSPKNVNNCAVCEKCGKKMSSHSVLQDHILKTHKELQSCAECHYKTSNKTNLKRHIELIHSNTSRRFPCLNCPAIFTSNAVKKAHMNSVHSDVRHFSCDICLAKFKMHSLLKRHMLTHQSATLPCPHCPMTFRRIDQRNRHMEKHNKKPPVLKPAKPKPIDISIPDAQVYSLIDVQSGELVTLSVSEMTQNSVLHMNGGELLNPDAWNNLDHAYELPLLPLDNPGPHYDYSADLGHQSTSHHLDLGTRQLADLDNIMLVDGHNSKADMLPSQLLSQSLLLSEIPVEVGSHTLDHVYMHDKKT